MNMRVRNQNVQSFSLFSILFWGFVSSKRTFCFMSTTTIELPTIMNSRHSYRTNNSCVWFPVRVSPACCFGFPVSVTIIVLFHYKRVCFLSIFEEKVYPFHSQLTSISATFYNKQKINCVWTKKLHGIKGTICLYSQLGTVAFILDGFHWRWKEYLYVVRYCYSILSGINGIWFICMSVKVYWSKGI